MRVVIDESIFGASAFLADSEARSRRGFSDFRTVARSSKTASDRCPQLIYPEKQSYVIIDVGAVEFDVYLTLFSYHELTGWRSCSCAALLFIFPNVVLAPGHVTRY
jgi:hypothetical protein